MRDAGEGFLLGRWPRGIWVVREGPEGQGREGGVGEGVVVVGWGEGGGFAGVFAGGFGGGAAHFCGWVLWGWGVVGRVWVLDGLFGSVRLGGGLLLCVGCGVVWMVCC